MSEDEWEWIGDRAFRNPPPADLWVFHVKLILPRFNFSDQAEKSTLIFDIVSPMVLPEEGRTLKKGSKAV